MFQDETVWLPIEQMSILFGKSRSTINEHILNIYKEGELSEADTMRKIGISDFSTKPTNFYNLDAVSSINHMLMLQLEQRRCPISIFRFPLMQVALAENDNTPILQVPLAKLEKDKT